MARRNYKEGAMVSRSPCLLSICPPHITGAVRCWSDRLAGHAVILYLRTSSGRGHMNHAPSDLEALVPGQEHLTLLMTDAWIRTGAFPMVWTDPSFSREGCWPLSEFGMYLGGDEQAWAVTTSDDPSRSNPSHGDLVAPEIARSLPEFGDTGYFELFMRLGDPSRPAMRLSDEPRCTTFSASGRRQHLRGSGRELRVDFVVRGTAKDRTTPIQRSLEATGWIVSTHRQAANDHDADPVWLTGVRLVGLTEAVDLAQLDAEMQSIARTYEVEYDGYGFDVAGTDTQLADH